MKPAILRRPSRKVRQTLFWGGGSLIASAIGGLFLALLIGKVEWGAVNNAMANASIPHLFAALGLMLAAFVLRGVRWRLLFHRVPISTVRLVLVENTAVGVNSLTPIPVLDEPTRLGLLALRGVPAGNVLATMATMRTFELATQAMVGSVGLAYLPPLRPMAPYFLAAAALSAVAILALFIIGPLVTRVPALGRLPLARDFSSGVQLMRRSPFATTLSFLMSVGYAVVIGLSGWMLGQGLNLGLGMLALIILSLAVIFFTDWLPGLPGAIGTFEFVALYLLGLWGVDSYAAFGYAVLLHALFFLPPFVVAVFYLPYAGFTSLEAVLGLVRQPWQKPQGTAAPGEQFETAQVVKPSVERP